MLKNNFHNYFQSPLSVLEGEVSLCTFLLLNAFPALPEVLGFSISLWLCWDLAEILGRLGFLSTLLRSVFIPDAQHKALHKVEYVGRMDEREASKILKFLGTRRRVNLVESHHWKWDRWTKQIWKWLSPHTPRVKILRSTYILWSAREGAWAEGSVWPVHR